MKCCVFYLHRSCITEFHGMYSSSISGYSINAVPGISPRINEIYLNGLIPFAFAVSISVYTPALASAPFGLPENNQFLRLCSKGHNRKNWMFHNTANGASSSALVYSISETAKLNNLRPYYYFKYILTELPKHCDEKGNIDPAKLDYLMPWSESLPEECRKPRRS